MLYFFVWIFVHLLVESLPLSSSGHVILLEKFLNGDYIFINNTLIDKGIFSHLLHGITALIIILFFFHRWYAFFSYFYKKYKAYTFFNVRLLSFSRILLHLFLLFIADIVTGFFYILFKLYGLPALPLSVGFFITGSALIGVSLLSYTKNRIIITLYDALYIGLVLGVVQGIALLPGISRLAVTYIAARLLRFSPQQSFELSLLIQLPLIVAASMSAGYSLYNAGLLHQLLHWSIVLSMVIGGIGAWYALRLTAYLVHTNRLWIFGIYLLLLALVWGEA